MLYTIPVVVVGLFVRLLLLIEQTKKKATIYTCLIVVVVVSLQTLVAVMAALHEDTASTMTIPYLFPLGDLTFFDMSVYGLAQRRS